MQPSITFPNVKGEACAGVGRWFLEKSEKLHCLQQAGLIADSHPHNACFAPRTIHEQIHEEGRWPSNAFKFAVMVPQGINFQSLHLTYHGNVSGRDLESIIREGLRGYSQNQEFVAGPTNCDGRMRRLGCTLVTPSPWLALEEYGYRVPLQDGSQLRMMLQIRCKNPVERIANTSSFRDEVHADTTMEWVVRAQDAVVIGLVVKHYASAWSLNKLKNIDGIEHRLFKECAAFAPRPVRRASWHHAPRGSDGSFVNRAAISLEAVRRPEDFQHFFSSDPDMFAFGFCHGCFWCYTTNLENDIYRNAWKYPGSISIRDWGHHEPNFHGFVIG